MTDQSGLPVTTLLSSSSSSSFSHSAKHFASTDIPTESNFSASLSLHSSSRSPVFPPHAFNVPTCRSSAFLRSPSFSFPSPFNVNPVRSVIEPLYNSEEARFARPPFSFPRDHHLPTFSLSHHLLQSGHPYAFLVERIRGREDSFIRTNTIACDRFDVSNVYLSLGVRHEKVKRGAPGGK